MKKFVQVIFVFLFVILVCETAFAQRTATHTLTNFNVNTITNKFSFDIYSIRTGGTSIRVGNTSYYIDFNFNALTNPVISNINTKFSTESETLDYDLMTVLVVSNKIAVTINFTGNGDGTGELLSTTPTIGERICTITLDITNQASNANITWDLVNSAMQTPLLQALVSTYEGSFNAPLPVELSSFTSKLMNDKVQLNWSTKTEVNNFGFDIERSTDGISFSKIGFVEGHGNSNSEKNYSYTDAPKSSSKYSYRLKQLDTDGKYEYSKIVEVDYVVKPTEYALSQNYPNPFNPSTVIKYQLPKDNFVSLKVYNAIGQEVANLVNEVKPTGVYEVNFDASNLSSGIYYYILRIGSGSSNEFTRTNKMVLLK